MSSEQEIADVEDEFFGTTDADDCEEIVRNMCQEIIRLRDRVGFLEAELTMLRRACNRFTAFFDQHKCRDFQDSDICSRFKTLLAGVRRNM